MAFDSTNPTHLTELSTELSTDPSSLGYAGKQPGEVRDIINLTRDTIDIDREHVPASELQSAVIGSEFVSLSNITQRGWLAIVGLGSDPGVPVGNTNIRGQIAAIWGAGTTTRSNLVALQTKKGSRAEQLWGERSFVTHQAIIAAEGG
jgi:hypothetical protein